MSKVKITIPGYKDVIIPADADESAMHAILDEVFADMDKGATEKAVDDLLNESRTTLRNRDREEADISQSLLTNGMRRQFTELVNSAREQQAKNAEAFEKAIASLEAQFTESSKDQQAAVSDGLSKLVSAINSVSNQNASIVDAVKQINIEIPEMPKIPKPAPPIKEINITNIVYGGPQDRAIGATMKVTKRGSV